MGKHLRKSLRPDPQNHHVNVFADLYSPTSALHGHCAGSRPAFSETARNESSPKARFQQETALEHLASYGCASIEAGNNRHAVDASEFLLLEAGSRTITELVEDGYRLPDSLRDVCACRSRHRRHQKYGQGSIRGVLTGSRFRRCCLHWASIVR